MWLHQELVVMADLLKVLPFLTPKTHPSKAAEDCMEEATTWRR